MSHQIWSPQNISANDGDANLVHGTKVALPQLIRRCGETIMRLQCSFIALALTLSPAAAAARSIGWQAYAVPETGAVVEIPTTVFTQDAGKPETGYGRRFLSSDGRADLTVQSVPNDAGDSPAVFLAKKNPPSNIVYKRITPRFFVVSSYRNGKIWYDRCNFSGRFMNCVLINYPAAEKRQWDSIVTRISNTMDSSGGGR